MGRLPNGPDGYGMLASLVRYRTVPLVALALFTALLANSAAGRLAHGADALLDGFTQSQVVAGLSGPTAMEFAPDGRLFVAEVGGTLRVIKDGQLLDGPFVDISDQVDSRGGRGLFGVAFDPAFAFGRAPTSTSTTRRRRQTGQSYNRVVRFTADGDKAVEGSEYSVFRMDDLGSSTKHNGGAIHFGTDGKLYIAVGDNKRNRTNPT